MIDNQDVEELHTWMTIELPGMPPAKGRFIQMVMRHGGHYIELVKDDGEILFFNVGALSPRKRRKNA